MKSEASRSFTEIKRPPRALQCLRALVHGSLLVNSWKYRQNKQLKCWNKHSILFHLHELLFQNHNSVGLISFLNTIFWTDKKVFSTYLVTMTVEFMPGRWAWHLRFQSCDSRDVWWWRDEASPWLLAHK